MISLGLLASAAARRRPEPPGLTRRSMPTAASVSSRSRGAAAASAAAGLVVLVSALMISVLRPSVGRGTRASIGRPSRIFDRAWAGGHSPRVSGGARGAGWGGGPAGPVVQELPGLSPAARHDDCPQHRPARPMARARPGGSVGSLPGPAAVQTMRGRALPRHWSQAVTRKESVMFKSLSTSLILPAVLAVH